VTLHSLRTGFPERSARTHAKTRHTWTVALRNRYARRRGACFLTAARNGKGTRGRDGEVDWTSAGTTLSRVDAMMESVGVQVATQLTWGRWLKTVPHVPWLQTVAADIKRHMALNSIVSSFNITAVQYILHLGKRSISLIHPTIRYYSTSFWPQVLLSFSPNVC